MSSYVCESGEVILHGRQMGVGPTKPVRLAGHPLQPYLDLLYAQSSIRGTPLATVVRSPESRLSPHPTCRSRAAFERGRADEGLPRGRPFIFFTRFARRRSLALTVIIELLPY